MKDQRLVQIRNGDYRDHRPVTLELVQYVDQLRTENARLRERVAVLEDRDAEFQAESKRLLDARFNSDKAGYERGAASERAAVVAWLREAVMGDAAAAIEAGEHHNRCKNCGGPKQSWQVYCGAACCAEAERG